VRRIRVAGLVLLSSFVLVPTAPASAPPAARLASLVKAVQAQHSVHYVSVEKHGTISVTMVGDVGAKAGIQRITYRSGEKTGHLTVVVSRRTAYMRGDAFTLEGFLGFPHAGSVKYADTWLRFRHTAAAYVPIAENVTFATTINGLKPAGRLTVVPRTKIDGQAVVGIRGTTRIQGQKVVRTLWVAPSGKRLVVSDVTTAPGGSLTVTYSRWNEPVRVRVPLDFIDSETGKTSGTVA